MINAKINKLKQIAAQNRTKNPLKKMKSLFASETFNSMFTEGEVSSRRQIERDFANFNGTTPSESYRDFWNAFLFVLEKHEFSIANLFTLYSLISAKRIRDQNKLVDGQMVRTDEVYIQTQNKNYQGFKPHDIAQALNDLFDFMRDSQYDLYLRAIVGHIYFEMIHPYYDFNGWTGRFLPLWIFVNEGRTSEMLYFATAVGHYRDQYLAIFKNINASTYEVNLDKMIDQLLNLLILNQEQSIWVKAVENKFLDLTNKSFSTLQKNIIWTLMIKAEISHCANGWFRIDNDDKKFIESKVTPSAFSNALRSLKANKIITIADTRPRKYKLNNYKLFTLRKQDSIPFEQAV